MIEIDHSCHSCADVLNSEYAFYHGLLLGVSTITMFKMLIRASILCHGRSQRIQKQAILICFLISLALLVQAIDPLGFRGIMPVNLDVLLVNLAACLGYLAIYLVARFLYNVRWNLPKQLGLADALFFAVLVIITSILTIMEHVFDVSPAARKWLRVVKMLFYSTLVLVTSLYLMCLLWYFHKVSRRLRKSSVRTVTYLVTAGMFSFAVVLIGVYTSVMIMNPPAMRSDITNPRCQIDFDDWAFPAVEATGAIVISALMGRPQSIQLDLTIS